MIASIQGGIFMISDMATVVGFLCLIMVKVCRSIDPLDCLGYNFLVVVS